jgi:hypothetical protein
MEFGKNSLVPNTAPAYLALPFDIFALSRIGVDADITHAYQFVGWTTGTAFNLATSILGIFPKRKDGELVMTPDNTEQTATAWYYDLFNVCNRQNNGKPSVYVWAPFSLDSGSFIANETPIDSVNPQGAWQNNGPRVMTDAGPVSIKAKDKIGSQEFVKWTPLVGGTIPTLANDPATLEVPQSCTAWLVAQYKTPSYFFPGMEPITLPSWWWNIAAHHFAPQFTPTGPGPVEYNARLSKRKR